MTGVMGPMHWSQHFRQLDRVGASMYPDLKNYHATVTRFDRLRGEKTSPYWLLETAPNWSGGGPIWNIHHDERGIRLFTWLSILCGGSMVLYWQWRSHWAGQEMQHGTCLNQTGAWQPGKETWQQLAQDFQRLGHWLCQHPVAPARIGLIQSCENLWLWSIDPIDRDNNNYLKHFQDYLHQPLVAAHYHRDIIDIDADWSAYEVLVLPRCPMISDANKARLTAWVADGGTLILGPLSGTRSMEMTAWTDQAFGGLEELIGAESSCRFSPHWVESELSVVFADGHRGQPSIWCEAFTTHENLSSSPPSSSTATAAETLSESASNQATILARYAGGYGDGQAAVLDHRYHQGRVITIGCSLDQETLQRLIQTAATDAGIEPLIASHRAHHSEQNEQQDNHSVSPRDVVAMPRSNKHGQVIALGLANTLKEPVSVTLPADQWPDQLTDTLNHETLGRTIVMNPLQVRIVTTQTQL